MYPAGLLGAGQATARCITRYLSGMVSIRSCAFSVSIPSSSICWTGGGLALLLTLVWLALVLCHAGRRALEGIVGTHSGDQTLHVVAN